MAKEFTLPAFGIVPAVSTSKKLPKRTEALLIPVFEGEDEVVLAASGLFDKKTELEVFQALVAVGATGAAEEITKVPAPKATGVDVIVAVGLGDADEVTETAVRRAAGVAARSLTGIERAATTLGAFGVQAAVEGFVLGAYTYRGLRTEKLTPRKTPVGEVVFVNADKTEVAQALISAEAVALARDLVNTASSHLYPETYAEFAATSAKREGINVEVLDHAALAKAGFGGILAVGEGSARPPRLVRLTYRAKKASKHVALVGKGVTFDTGGISIKPAANMDHMIMDMGGSAAVLAAIIAAARLKLPVNVTATIPLAENMPGGGAYRPGDVITHYGGTTCEIMNTDAEGRLILADAIARACEDDPDYLIEAATLTGAQLVALGTRTTGVMGSDELRDRIAALGREVDEPTWAMPIPEETAASLKSPVADLRNLPNHRNAGMLAAGYFLEQFVADGVEWAHLDIAGPAFNAESAHGFTPARGTGAPVRTLIAALRDIAEKG
ncbi:leucyl aminopeptidase [Corynebacterium sp.]|uniref:leucyl aminopeptidase n=1 Tax=Corynebacterium sp. TaxID=1720 RepID=UPI0026DC8C6D|nr:leucyl aminopeptidase [Corynebacterium sp.]MDO5075972.1 leucyl aminopeptidase [Corynebacterium sp.]